MVSLFYVFSCLLCTVRALHMYIGENGDPACFSVVLAKDALLSEKHSAWELETSSNKWIRDETLQVEVTIDEAFGKFNRPYNHKMAPFSEFQFIALEAGDHRICYRALVNNWWPKNKVKLEVDFKIGVGSDVVDTTSEKRLSYLAERVSELTRKFVHIYREQRVLREREVSFRDISEYTNSRAVYMTVFQLLVLTATCVWQVSHLKSFFVKQKLV